MLHRGGGRGGEEVRGDWCHSKRECCEKRNKESKECHFTGVPKVDIGDYGQKLCNGPLVLAVQENLLTFSRLSCKFAFVVICAHLLKARGQSRHRN